MKRHITALLLFSLLLTGAVTSSAQVWFDLGAKGLFAGSVLYNNNLINDRSVKMKLGTLTGGGGKFGINIGEYHGVIFEGLYQIGKQNWDYELSLAGVTTLVPVSNNWTQMKWYGLYRFYSERSYIEIGPHLTQLKKATRTVGELAEQDMTKYLNTQQYGASLGFGAFLFGNNTFATVLGFRLDYQFGDWVNADGKNARYPHPERFPVYESHKATNPLSLAVTLEFNFGFGGFAEAACGRRGFVFGGR